MTRFFEGIRALDPTRSPTDIRTDKVTSAWRRRAAGAC